VGCRHFRTADGITYIDQNFDNYAVEYTYPDGSKMFFDGRSVPGADVQYCSYLQGTKGLGIVTKKSDSGGPSAIFKGQNEDPANQIWESKDKSNPYQNEWDTLIDAIRNNKPYNEVKHSVEASLSTSMGRMACHTGQVITFEQMLNCDHQFAPGIDKLTKDSPAPVMPGADGLYPQPVPGMKKREY
jgi:hypothetical protein